LFNPQRRILWKVALLRPLGVNHHIFQLRQYARKRANRRFWFAFFNFPFSDWPGQFEKRRRGPRRWMPFSAIVICARENARADWKSLSAKWVHVWPATAANETAKEQKIFIIFTFCMILWRYSGAVIYERFGHQRHPCRPRSNKIEPPIRAFTKNENM